MTSFAWSCHKTQTATGQRRNTGRLTWRWRATNRLGRCAGGSGGATSTKFASANYASDLGFRAPQPEGVFQNQAKSVPTRLLATSRNALTLVFDGV